MDSADTFADVAAEADFEPGEARRVRVDGKAVALFRTPEGFLAFDDACPHAGGPLSEGVLDDGVLVCPWHGFRYDTGTGACLIGDEFPAARRREVRLEAGRILVSR